MAHISLYRRFRPQRFDAVVGQANTITTLTNQVESGRLAHAYLFTGSRGTGKTSTARILARALNCEAPDGVNPCNRCATCQSILNDANIDVIEMDAASNNGVDDIRELRDIVKFPPSSCNYKVMIIDEVHMLSKGAFNALLKTLEEPPAYIVFVLATTEPHKVPATISSRCQHFSFRRIEDDVMLKDLQARCREMGLTVETTALQLIVKLADGALRNAYSLLEQSSTYGGTTLTYQVVSQALGRSADQAVEQLAEAIIAGDQTALLNLLDAHYRAGKDSALLIDDLIDLFRCALIATLSDDVAAATPLKTRQQWLNDIAYRHGARRWQAILNHLLQMAQTIKYQSHAWLALELGLLEIADGTGADGADLTDRLSALQGEVAALRTRLERREAGVEPAQSRPTNNRQPAFTATPGGQQQLTDQAVDQAALQSAPVKATQTAVEQVASSAPTDAPAPAPPKSDAALDLDAIKADWPQFMQHIKSILTTTFALMEQVQPIAFSDGKLTLQMDAAVKILKQNITQPKHIANIERAFSDIYRATAQIEIVVAGESDRAEAVRTYFEGVTTDANIIIE